MALYAKRPTIARMGFDSQGSEDQPRDGSGRWTDGGSGDAGDSKDAGNVPPTIGAPYTKGWGEERERQIAEAKTAAIGMYDHAVLRAAYQDGKVVAGLKIDIHTIAREPDYDAPRTLNTKTGDYERPDRTMVRGKLYNEAGKEVGNFVRSVRDGGKEVHHDYLRLTKEYEGKGFAMEFNRNAENHYLANGVERVTLLANIDVGGYAWARQGYEPVSKEEFDSLKRDLLGNGGGGKGDGDFDLRVKNTTEKMDAEIRRRIDGARSIVQIASMKINKGWAVKWEGKDKGYHIGKAILLGSSWQGIKRLDPRDKTAKVGELAWRAHTEKRKK